MCECGWPIVVCRDPENDGWFELSERTQVCQVRAVIDRENKDRRDNPNYQPAPGEILSVVYTKGREGSEEEPAATE